MIPLAMALQSAGQHQPASEDTSLFLSASLTLLLFGKPSWGDYWAPGPLGRWVDALYEKNQPASSAGQMIFFALPKFLSVV